MGATSLLKVTGRFASCACATSGTARTSERHKLALRAIIASSFDTDLRLSVRPTAVISEISGGLTRAVIHHDLKDVFARLAEACGGNSPPVDKLRFGLTEYDGAGPRIHRPHGRHADRFAASCGQPVIGRRHGEGYGAGAGNRTLRGFYAHLGRRVGIDLLAVSPARCAQAVDHPNRFQRPGNLSGLTMRGKRPHQRAIAEILRQDNLEYNLVAPHHEMRRLAAIAVGLEVIVGPDRDVHLFFVVPIHVPEPHVVRTVGIDVIAFVHRRDALSGPMANLCELAAGGLELHQQDQKTTNCNSGVHSGLIIPRLHFSVAYFCSSGRRSRMLFTFSRSRVLSMSFAVAEAPRTGVINSRALATT